MKNSWPGRSILSSQITLDPTLPGLRDWISSPKSTGYEALHITVMGPKGRWVEVQIRSERMNEIAEKGYAAHYKYKQGNQEDGLEEWVNKLAGSSGKSRSECGRFCGTVQTEPVFKRDLCIYPPGGIKIPSKGSDSIWILLSVYIQKLVCEPAAHG